MQVGKHQKLRQFYSSLKDNQKEKCTNEYPFAPMVKASKFPGVNLYSERPKDSSTNSLGLGKGFCSAYMGV